MTVGPPDLIVASISSAYISPEPLSEPLCASHRGSILDDLAVLYKNTEHGGYSGTTISYTATQNCIATGLALAIEDGNGRTCYEDVSSTGTSLGNDCYYLETGQSITCSASVSGGSNSKSICSITAFYAP